MFKFFFKGLAKGVFSIFQVGQMVLVSLSSNGDFITIEIPVSASFN